MTPSRRAFAWTTLLAVLLDQGSKAMVEAWLRPGRDELVLVPGLLSFIHARNSAAAFGAFSDVPNRRWIFLALTLASAPIVGWLVGRLPASAWRTAVAVGLMVGGALGNFIDRARTGQVVDFIRVYTDQPAASAWLRAHVGTNEWPTFNVADSTLVVGVLLYAALAMFPDDSEDPETDDSAPEMQ